MSDYVVPDLDGNSSSGDFAAYVANAIRQLGYDVSVNSSPWAIWMWTPTATAGCASPNAAGHCCAASRHYGCVANASRKRPK